ncbi:MAG: Unknown protein [uncultured Sulfurovum sp.]|uniref:Uncharacterized protein n=1 Tax=uncultured Sulfurovum sp. TaxID=269237 RepID=A0A6S6S659_9BACT|nr:MAG: Unknown protein [uncultured Sulfurovum sp.]
MKLSSPLLSCLLNFLLGAAWAFALAGATIVFYLYLEIGFIYAIFSALIATLPGLFLVLFIEYFFMKQETLSELKKQTELLEELTRKS